MRFMPGLLLLLAAAHAQADGRVAVEEFEGPRAGQARKAVVAALSGEVDVVGPDEVVDAADALGTSLDSAEGRVAVARKLGLRAFVAGTVAKAGKRLRLTLTVHNGADGTAVGDAQVSGRKKKFRRRVKGRSWAGLQPLIAQTAVPEPEAAEPTPAADEAAEEEGVAAAELEAGWGGDDEDDDGDDSPAAPGDAPGLVFDLGFGLGAREYGYPDEANLDGLAGYSLSPWADSAGLIPNLDLALQVYPLALFGSRGMLAGLGFDIRYQKSFGIDSEDAVTGAVYETNASAVSADVRMRFPSETLDPAVFLGLGQRSFELDKGAGVPAVAFTSVRLGGDVRYTGIDSIPLQLRLGLLLPVGFGGLVGDNWYPNASGLGMLGELRGGYALSDLLEPFVALGYERYGLTFDPEPDSSTDTLGRVAGGATDEYYQLLLGVSMRL